MGKPSTEPRAISIFDLSEAAKSSGLKATVAAAAVASSAAVSSVSSVAASSGTFSKVVSTLLELTEDTAGAVVMVDEVVVAEVRPINSKRSRAEVAAELNDCPTNSKKLMTPPDCDDEEDDPLPLVLPPLIDDDVLPEITDAGIDAI